MICCVARNVSCVGTLWSVEGRTSIRRGQQHAEQSAATESQSAGSLPVMLHHAQLHRCILLAHRAARGKGAADADVDTPRNSSDASAAPALAAHEASTSAPAAATANGHFQHPLQRESSAPHAGPNQPAINGIPTVADASGRAAAAAQNGASHVPRMNGLHQRRESIGDSRSIESRGGTSGEIADAAAEDASDAEARRLQELRCRWDDVLAQASLQPGVA